ADEFLVDYIAQRVIEGATLKDIARERGMPSVHTLYSWTHKRPDFAAAIADAKEAREDRLHDVMRELSQAATPATLRYIRAAITPLRKKAWRLQAKREGRR